MSGGWHRRCGSTPGKGQDRALERGAERAEEQTLNDENVLRVSGTEESGDVQRGVDERERTQREEMIGDHGTTERACRNGEEGGIVGEEKESVLVGVDGGGVGRVSYGGVGELKGDEGKVADHVEDVTNQVKFTPYFSNWRKEPNRPR